MSERDKNDADQRALTLVTVDVVIFTLQNSDLQVLLVRRRRPPQEGMWAIHGGLIKPDEALEAAALRTLEDVTGLTV